MLTDDKGRVEVYRDGEKVYMALCVNGRVLEVRMTPQEAGKVMDELSAQIFRLTGSYRVYQDGKG